jgi:hypothetical protein
MKRGIILAVFVLISAISGIAENKANPEKPVIKKEVNDSESASGLKNEIKKTQIGVLDFNKRLTKRINKFYLIFITIILLMGATIIYLFYKINDLQKYYSKRDRIVNRQLDSFRSSFITKNHLDDRLLMLAKHLNSEKSSLPDQGANLGQKQPHSNQTPTFINVPKPNEEQSVQPTKKPKKIAVAYDSEKKVFTKSNNSKVYYLLAETKLAELWLEERMKEINDISFQNEFSQHFQITQTSQKSLSSGYYVRKPARVVWDFESETGTFKFPGTIDRNTN